MRHAVALDRDIGGQLQSRGVDGAIAWLATRQHGVVSRAQLLAAGFGADAIQHRIVTQRLHPVFRGVYAAGHARLTRQGRWMASVLAAGEGAVLSHRSAAALWGLRQTNGRVEVTIRPGRRGPPRLTVHRSSLPFDEVTEHDGIPVTTVSRTLLDSAAGMRPDQIERMLREAEFLRLTDPVGIDVLLERHPRRAGSRTLRRAVNEMNDSIGRTRSELEDRFKALISKANLPTPEANATIELGERTIEPDFLWREHRLIVELDGYQAHGTRAAFEADRARDRAATLAGFRVVRATWAQLGDGLVRDLRQMLAQ